MQDDDLGDERGSDELRIEDLDTTHADGRSRALIRRMWNVWQGRGGNRGRAASARVVAAGLTAVLALTLVCIAGDGRPQFASSVSRGSAPAWVTASETTALAGKAPMRAGTGPWELLTLPSPGGVITWYAASPSDPATLYACTGQGDNTLPANSTAQMTLAWRTRDAGAHWSTLLLPALPAAWCQTQVAQDAPQRVTVLSGDQLYLSDDGGDSWSSIARPSFAHQGDPNYTFQSYEVLPTAHHLYVQQDYFYYPPVTPPPGGQQATNRQELSDFARSDDDGRTWAFEGAELGHGFFRPFVLGNEDTLIASTIPMGGPSSGPLVWLSRDAGATWTPLASLQQGWTANLVTNPVGSANLPVYAMIDEQVPSSLFRLKVQQLYPRRGNDAWTPLPPLPVTGASPSRVGLLDLAGELPDGRLLALGVDPSKGVPADPSAVGGSADAIHAALVAPWLWEWLPDHARWQALVAVPPVPPPEAMCAALCWMRGLTYLPGSDRQPAGMYLTLYSGKTTAPVVDRIFLPASGTLG